MKIFLTLHLSLIFHFCCFSQQRDSFSLSGKIDNMAQNEFITLFHIKDDGTRIIDSSRIIDGSFSFKISIDHPTRFKIRGHIKSFDHSDPNAVDVFLDPAKSYSINLKYGKFKQVVIENSLSNREFIEFQNSPDKKTLIQKNKNSFVSAYFLRNHMEQYPFDSLKLHYNSFSSDVRNGYEGREIGKYIENQDESGPGKPAKTFSKTGHDGVAVNLVDYKDKYVLLDFWASWCGPCRAENPKLIALYNAHRSKGLQIIGVSDDDNDPKKWLAAITKDKLPWKHVLRGFESSKVNSPDDLTLLYGVNSLPTFVLIGPDGVILKKLSGEKSVDELKRIFDGIFE